METVAKDTPLVNEKGNENEELETPVEDVQSFANEVKATDETCAKVGEFVSFGFFFDVRFCSFFLIICQDYWRRWSGG